MAKKQKEEKKQAGDSPDQAASSAPKFDGDPKIGMIIGGIIGAALGFAYGKLPKITDLSLGPIPGFVVGLVFGTAFGVILGGIAGTIGKGMLTTKAAIGFAIGFLIILIGRLADDTGKGGYDTPGLIMDIVAGGIFWGTFGAIVAASGIADGSDKNGGDQGGDPVPRAKQDEIDEKNVGHEGG